MDLVQLVGLFQSWGPSIGLGVTVLFFFLWKDCRREDRLQARIEKLEQDQKEIMFPMLEKCVGVIAKNTEVMQSVNTMLLRRD